MASVEAFALVPGSGLGRACSSTCMGNSHYLGSSESSISVKPFSGSSFTCSALFYDLLSYCLLSMNASLKPLLRNLC